LKKTVFPITVFNWENTEAIEDFVEDETYEEDDEEDEKDKEEVTVSNENSSVSAEKDHKNCACCHQPTNDFQYVKNSDSTEIADCSKTWLCCGGKGICKKRIRSWKSVGKCMKCKSYFQDSLVADNGYFSERNVGKCLENEIIPYLSPNREKHNISLKERFSEPGILDKDASTMDQMRHRLKTKEGKALYAKRKHTVEPVFGIIKAVMGFRQFMLRGAESVRGEWNLVCIAYNLKRLHRLKA